MLLLGRDGPDWFAIHTQTLDYTLAVYLKTKWTVD